ncbi:hypothetical protein BCR39DRAFT_9041 [Naematelia encephala]|uniref:Uncharacterized protein n=1 Tax=Naematelia encephala TaxID=71784 RepID=A0A1Y2BL20_9TREE|nr:hypothetical protein BCR39DRAFT_9041 [Naematelia encephala]
MSASASNTVQSSSHSKPPKADLQVSVWYGYEGRPSGILETSFTNDSRINEDKDDMLAEVTPLLSEDDYKTKVTEATIVALSGKRLKGGAQLGTATRSTLKSALDRRNKTHDVQWTCKGGSVSIKKGEELMPTQQDATASTGFQNVLDAAWTAACAEFSGGTQTGRTQTEGGPSTSS